MDDLKTLRKEIDNIDGELVDLFERRMEIVLKISEYKKENNIPILNSSREKEVIKRNVQRLRNKSFKEGLEEFFINLMNISKKLQSQQNKK